MKTYMDCIPCFVRQTLEVARMVSDKPEIQENIMREALALARNLDFSDSPPALAQKMHRVARDLSRNSDPYKNLKKQFNDFALELYPTLKQRVLNSGDRLDTAARIAIAGNIIDFGVHSKVSRTDVNHSIDQALEAPIPPDVISSLKKQIKKATDILYLGDNAGEIVLDRLLIEQMPTDKLSFVVKGKPIINDVTMEDAEDVGMTKVCDVIDNGADVPGTILELCSPEFRERFEKADLIIAKGQGNYETLSRVKHKIFFLLKAKCPVIARDIGCEIGKVIILEKN